MPETPTLSLPDRFSCQTCGNLPVRIITIDLEDQASTDMECFGCWLAKAMAVLKGLAEQGLLDDMVAQPAPDK